jgi:gluconokinase
MNEPARTEMAVAPPIVVMGVSGSGKTTIGLRLADTLALPFIDADDLHPPVNKAKMRRGAPLTDEDRWPWLDAVGHSLAETAPCVVACSALRRAYRDRLRRAAPHILFIYLAGSEQIIAHRLSDRQHEYMPPTLLDSQLSILEIPEPDESAIAIDIAQEPRRIVQAAVEYVRLAAKGSTR